MAGFVSKQPNGLYGLLAEIIMTYIQSKNVMYIRNRLEQDTRFL